MNVSSPVRWNDPNLIVAMPSRAVGTSVPFPCTGRVAQRGDLDTRSRGPTGSVLSARFDADATTGGVTMAIDASAAAELYVYGYPLVYCTDEIVKLTDGRSTLFPQGTAFNAFVSARDLLGSDANFVSPNNDTLYVMAPVDL